MTTNTLTLIKNTMDRDPLARHLAEELDDLL